MRVGLAQINSTLGDFAHNRERIVEYAHRAKAKRCELVVFPELALMGYLPNDLLENSGVIDRQLKEFAKLQKQIPDGIAVLLGLITRTGRKKGKPYFNSAALLRRGKRPKFFHKELLPTYDVFDEARHIAPGKIAEGFVTLGKQRLLITICEDIWGWELKNHPTNYLENPLTKLRGKRVDAVINLSASPFTLAKVADRQSVVRATAKNFSAPVVYVNMVGGQDEVIFDGGSFAVDARGRTIAQNAYFSEDLNVVDLESGVGGKHEKLAARRSENLRRALVLGLRDFAGKTGLTRVHFGLSGGIDSSVVACLAVDAFGANRVTAVTLPGPFSDSQSRELAALLAKNLGIHILNFDINLAYEAALNTLTSGYAQALEFGLVQENLQARLRGLMLMAVSNKESSLLLATGNKSEFATGFSTLYGDMCGGLAPIGDLLKRQVYELAALYNSERELIPKKIITRPPTAELRPGQLDADSLPPYDELDRAVEKLVEKKQAARGKTERWLSEALARSEFKRWQAPPILKVSDHAFGRGRRMPIANFRQPN